MPHNRPEVHLPRHLQATLLLAPGTSGSVLAESVAGRPRRIDYCPYGNRAAHTSAQSRMAFNAQLLEPQGWYHLGNGHRVYNPQLRRFHSPDRLSPFDKGGINAYAYCQGDPINFTDPTGRVLQDIHIGSILGQSLALVISLTFLIVPPLAQAGHLAWMVNKGMGIAAPLGNVEMASVMLAAVSASVGLAATAVLVPDPPLMGSELMWVTIGMSAFAGLLKFGVYLTPNTGFAQGSRMHRFARFVHGDHILNAKAAPNAVQEGMEMVVSSRLQFRPPTPPPPPRPPKRMNPARLREEAKRIRLRTRPKNGDLETDV